MRTSPERIARILAAIALIHIGQALVALSAAFPRGTVGRVTFARTAQGCALTAIRIVHTAYGVKP